MEMLKVLVVDDDSKFVETLTQSLKSKDCEVTAITKGNEVLPYLIREPYHVVFLDCVLRKYNGMEISKKIREILGESIQIVMMSGIVPEKSLSTYIDLGMCDFLSKPIFDKELRITLRKIRDKYIYGVQSNILTKLFKKNTTTLDILKFLVSLKTVNDYEFFLYLSHALSSKECLRLDFTFNNKSHKLILNKGAFIDYECESVQYFLERCLSKNYINENEAIQLKGKSQQESVDYLISHCIVSPKQVIDLKHDLFLETLKSISSGMEIKLNFEIHSYKKESFLFLDQNEYADLVFLFLKHQFNNKIFDLFDDNIMKKHMNFDKENHIYHPDLDTVIIDELKSGMKLKGIYDNYIQDKNIFCFCILYILLKGGVFLSEEQVDVRSQLIYQRYVNLYNFFTKSKKTEDVFLQMNQHSKLKSLSNEHKSDIYKQFLKKNHPDVLSVYNLKENVISQVNKTIFAFKRVYEMETSHAVKMKMLEEKKKVALEKEVILSEKKKIIENYLEKKFYEKAFSILKEIPEKKLVEDLDWQMYYLWFFFKSKDKFSIDEKRIINFMQSLQRKKEALKANKLYYYIVGLNYFKNKDYSKAMASFKACKALGYSFQAVYEDIKNCAILVAKEKKSHTNSLVHKLKLFKLSIDKKVS